MRTLSILISLATVLIGCTSALESGGFAQPKPTTSDFFESEAAGVLITRSTKEFRMYIGLKVVTAPPPFAVAIATFQNPSSSDPLVSPPQVVGQSTTVRFESEPVQGLLAATAYEIVVDVYSDDSLSTLLSSHKQLFRSDFNQANVLQQLQ